MAITIPKSYNLQEITQSVEQLVCETIRSTPIDYYYYARLYKDGTYEGVNNHAAWARFCLEGMTFLEDFVYKEQQRRIGFTLVDITMPGIAGVANGFNIYNILGLIRLHPKYYEFCSLGCYSANPYFYNWCFDNKERILAIINQFRYDFDMNRRHILKEPVITAEQAKSFNVDLEKIFVNYNDYIKHPANMLTRMEYEYLQLIVSGMTVKEIASFMNRSPRTIEVHVSNIKEKLGIYSSKNLLRQFQEFVI